MSLHPSHPLSVRQSGVLLHPTSLPGRHGIGDLGPAARDFVDWLARAGARLWQVLPLCPPGGPLDDVPYASAAALAGHTLLLSLDDLHAAGLLEARELEGPRFAEGWADLARVRGWKEPLLARAAGRLLDGASHPLIRRWPPSVPKPAGPRRPRSSPPSARSTAARPGGAGQRGCATATSPRWGVPGTATPGPSSAAWPCSSSSNGSGRRSARTRGPVACSSWATCRSTCSTTASTSGRIARASGSIPAVRSSP